LASADRLAITLANTMGCPMGWDGLAERLDQLRSWTALRLHWAAAVRSASFD